MVKDLSRSKNRIHNWLDRYFPEYKDVYKNWEAKSFIKILKDFTFPGVLCQSSAEEVYGILPGKLRRGVGLRKITKLVNISKNSIGTTEGIDIAKEEIKYLLKQYDVVSTEIEMINAKIEEICSGLSEVKKNIRN